MTAAQRTIRKVEARSSGNYVWKTAYRRTTRKVAMRSPGMYVWMIGNVKDRREI